MKVTVSQGENFVLTNEHVLRQAAVQPLLQTVFVLVPDRFTLQAERLLLKYRPHLLNTRVVTFSMLYRLVASEINQGIEPQVLDKTSAVLHLWTAIRQVQDQLTWFKTSVGHYDFAEKMFNTINQMRSSCVDFATLETQAKTAVARKKYHDINLIYQAYRQMIATQTDTSGMLEYLIAHLSQSQTIQKATFFVCGFTSLSPARLQVLHAICESAEKVVIGSSEAELNAQLSAFRHYQVDDIQRFTPQLVTARCETERGEANVILQRIAELINQGVSPEEIVVLLTEFDTLAPVWQVVAEKYQLPINLDVGTKLSTTAEAKYLRDLLELLVNDDAENTIAVLFNQCSEVTEETMFDLDNQIVKANLRARVVPDIKKLTATKDIGTLCEQLKSFTDNEKLKNIFDQIAAGCQIQPLNLRELINLYWTLCSATKISQIPQYIERVLIAPVNDWVPTNVKYLFIANCTAENFPQGQSDDDILQEADLVDTQITPTPKLQRERNYRRAELLKTIATKQVTLSGTCDEFAAVSYEPYYTFQWPEDDQSAITVGKDLFFAKQRVKTTMLESYYNCPHLNFLENGLHLRPRPIYKLEANTVGSAIHEALQSYLLTHDIEAAVKVGLNKLAFNYPPLTQNVAKEIRFILGELDKIFADSQFKFQIEVEKDVERILPNGYKLVGRVDRVDVAELPTGERAFMVLDYKTGNVSGSLAKDIYLGNKLQLPVYASALSNLGEIAGAGYLPLSKGYSQDEKRFLLKGFINQEHKELFPPQIISSAAKSISPVAIARLCNHANSLVDVAVEKIMSGYVAAEPVNENVCNYCSVRAFCQRKQGPYRDADVSITYKTFEEGNNG